MTYVASLDGIRAIAILAVLVFHVSPVALSGGFAGVDVFFVLSGFLITSIILHDIREGSFSIREFYLRRIQRLLPNIFLTVFTVVLLWTLLLPAQQARQTARHGLWTIFDLSNIYAWRNLHSYWGNAAEWAPLTHTWSLGLEEQFYLFFPGFLLLLARFQPTRVRCWLIVTTALSFGMCLYSTSPHPAATFYLLPTRLWELLLGAILAILRTPMRNQELSPELQIGGKTREAIGWAGFGVVIASFVFINGGYKFPGLVSLAPTVGTALVLLSISAGQTRLSRFLSIPWMVRTGKISYSLYLWHWPLITFGKIEADLYGMPLLAGSVAGAFVGILLSWVAYVVVEQPLRKRGPGRGWRLAKIAAGFSIVVLCCGVVAARRPVADMGHRFDTPTFPGELFTAGRGAGPEELSENSGFSDVDFPTLPLRPNDSWRTGGVLHLYGGGHPKVVVLGSSHALMYSRLVDDICREKSLSVAFLGMDAGTPAFFESFFNRNFSSQEEPKEFDESRRKWLREWRPDAVLVIDQWDTTAVAEKRFDVELRSFLKVVCPLACRVIFVCQVPVVNLGNEINLRGFVTWRMSNGKGLPRLMPDSNERLRKEAVTIAQEASAEFPNLRVLRADLPFYQEDGSIRYASGRSFFYADSNHLTDVGTEVVRGLFEKEIAEAHSGSSSRQGG